MGATVVGRSNGREGSRLVRTTVVGCLRGKAGGRLVGPTGVEYSGGVLGRKTVGLQGRPLLGTSIVANLRRDLRTEPARGALVGPIPGFPRRQK